MELNAESYNERCRVAAQAQGIDTIVNYLKEGGIIAEVAQTGGFTMVAEVPSPGGGPEFLGFTVEGSVWLVCEYQDLEDEGTLVGALPPEAAREHARIWCLERA